MLQRLAALKDVEVFELPAPKAARMRNERSNIITANTVVDDGQERASGGELMNANTEQ